MSNKTDEKKYRYVSLEGCKLLGQVKHGRLYELNDDTAPAQIGPERTNGKKDT